MKGIYTEYENPLPWLDYTLNSVEHANLLHGICQSLYDGKLAGYL